MVKEIGPNTRCSCGSGKKYKNCHGATTGGTFSGKGSGRKIPMGYWVAGAIVLAVAGFAIYNSQAGSAPGEAPPGKVWSSEHGHWHDAP